MGIEIFPFEMTNDDAAPAEAEQEHAPPSGFRLAPAGIYYEVDRDGEVEWRWLCSRIRVLALPRGTDGKGWGRLVEIEDPDGNCHRWAMPAELLAGDGTEMRKECMRLGMQLATGSKARNSFSDLLQMWTPDTRATTADRLGWSDETCRAFVLGSGKVVGDSNVVYQSEHASGAAAEMRSAGAPDDWLRHVGLPCTGNPLMVTAVSLAFAGALFEPMQLEGGGLHLRGASSSGKSTLLKAATSVWGSPKFVQSWRATSNGLEGVAAACNGSLIALDEMGEISGREAGAAAYMLANGQGKARATRTGVARPSMRWRTAILSSGEVSLSDKLAEVGQRVHAGQEVRLLDICADGQTFGAFDTLHGQDEPAAFANAIARGAAVSYGTAGPAFVEHLLSDMDAATQQARAHSDEFRRIATARFGLGSEGQVSRAVARLGLIAAAGEMACAWGITGWEVGTAQNAALSVLGIWLSGRGGTGHMEARQAVARVRAFLVENGGSRFEALGYPPDGRLVPNRAGWRKEGTYYIATDTWRDIHAGSDPVRAVHYLRAEGYLSAGDGNNLAQRLPSTVTGRPRAYAISAEILGAPHD